MIVWDIMKIILKLVIIGALFFLTVPQIILASACVSNAMQRCVGYSVFWYDSCGQKQNWIKDCSYKCQNGQCINKPITITPTTPIVPTTPNNCEPQIVCPINWIDTSIFCGIQNNSINLSKNITITADQTINCLIIAKNTSTASINDVILRADIPAEIVSISEVKIDGMASNGNITSGIDIGSFPPNTSKLVIFTGKTLSPITQAITKQIIGIASSGVLSSSDSLTINFQPNIASASTASLESSTESSLFVEFFKRWYIWILIGIVLIFLFFVIFRRLSSNI